MKRKKFSGWIYDRLCTAEKRSMNLSTGSKKLFKLQHGQKKYNNINNNNFITIKITINRDSVTCEITSRGLKLHKIEVPYGEEKKNEEEKNT